MLKMLGFYLTREELLGTLTRLDPEWTVSTVDGDRVDLPE